MNEQRPIRLRGVSVHNLKSIDLDLPARQVTVLCGVSGSGKSSLALDTLYAEGQRRYLESFSPFVRQFLVRMERPAAERIEGIRPTIAVNPAAAAAPANATICTITDIDEYLRLAFARSSRPLCQACNFEVSRDTPTTVADLLSGIETRARAMIAFALTETDPAGIAALQQRGFLRVIQGGRTVRLDGTEEAEHLARDEPIWVVVDRLTLPVGTDGRLLDSLETAFDQGEGRCALFVEPTDGNSESLGEAVDIDGRPFRRVQFSTELRCNGCGRIFPEPTPRLFDRNAAPGACSVCGGSGEASERDCSACEGSGLNDDALSFRLGEWNFGQWLQATLADVARHLDAWNPGETDSQVAGPLLRQIRNRLELLEQVNVGYLALGHKMPNLSTGEAGRVTLARVLGTALVDAIYVLDEPTVGLHPHDLPGVLEAIRQIRDRQNTVVVVEHDPQVIRAADHVVEIGPRAGDEGGQVTFEGTPRQMIAAKGCLTGDYLAGRLQVISAEEQREPPRGWLELKGARGRHLQNIDVRFPLGALCVVCGISGAGKSTLVRETLYPAVKSGLGKDELAGLPYEEVSGVEQLSDCVLVDRTPVGRSPRSNPVTYLKAFDLIRKVFAQATEARMRNYDAGHFSFNSPRGRCGTCEGDGQLQIDMKFLPDVYVTCPDCGGTRYRSEILEVTYRNRHIAEVLAMSVREAFRFFRGQPKLQARLKQLMDVGLDYLQLGQPANTLSGGESQRLKLAAHLRASRGHTLFLLEEPSTGLHFADLAKLLDCFRALLAVGHSLVLVEHNLALMQCADWLIELGPGPGPRGGQVVAQGTPDKLAGDANSLTGSYLCQAASEFHR